MPTNRLNHWGRRASAGHGATLRYSDKVAHVSTVDEHNAARRPLPRIRRSGGKKCDLGGGLPSMLSPLHDWRGP